MKVLVAEDDIDVAKAFAKTIRGMGHDVMIVHNGREAVEVASHNKVDLVILDLVMPQLTGLGFLEEAHKKGWLKCPVIVISAFRSTDLAELPNIDTVLTKPVEQRELQAAVKQ